jgi:hypothetical protein
MALKTVDKFENIKKKRLCLEDEKLFKGFPTVVGVEKSFKLR